MKAWKRFGLVTLVLGVGMFSGNKVKADGSLNVRNFINSESKNYAQINKFPASYGIVDEWDSFDHEIPGFPSDGSYIVTDINDVSHPNLDKDFKPTESDTPFSIKLVCQGEDMPKTSNNLEFYELSNGSFGDKEILFQSDALPYGSVVDVRAAIAQNGGVVSLEDLSAGTYTTGTPYATGTLTIGTRKLADLNDDGDVNMKDLAILSQDWNKPAGGQYVGDITGPHGIPDGNVDIYDMKELASSWLE